MAIPVGQRIRNAWNVFLRKDPSIDYTQGVAYYSSRPDRVNISFSTERSYLASVFTQIGVDVSSVEFHHARLDQNGKYLSEINSRLNDCLTLRANIDQSAKAFIQDVVSTICEEGTAAIVPVDTSDNPTDTGSYDIYTMRVGRVVRWLPMHVVVELYDDLVGQIKEVTVSKEQVAIVYNPLYLVMNEPNSTLKRLIRKLNLLDVIDEQSGSGKLDIIIQLPYTLRSTSQRDKAEQRRKDIELQLKDSKYGIAYSDATEKIVQLNRPAENNLMSQIEYLTDQLYSQLGITKAVLDGTADDKMMQNYYNRTVDPIITAITDAMTWAFLTTTARSQHQAIVFRRDPFKHVPVGDFAEMSDKFTRNAILSSNEIRQVLGYSPVDDPEADKLSNKNLNQQTESSQEETPDASSDGETEPQDNEEKNNGV